MTGNGDSGSASGPSRIVVVDDHPVILKGLHRLIAETDDLEVCGDAGDVATALEVIQATRPDLVLTDLSLPGESGLDLAVRLARLADPPRVLVMSMHDETLFADRALRAGALGYLNKAEPGPTILRAIRTVLGGRLYMSPTMTQRLLKLMASSARGADGDAMPKLSERELGVLERIASGLGTRQIAEELQLSIKTVESYRDNIKRKLGLPSHRELIRYAALLGTVHGREHLEAASEP